MGALQDAVEGFLYYLKVERKRSDNTLEAYRRDATAFVTWLSGREVGAVLPALTSGTLTSDAPTSDAPA